MTTFRSSILVVFVAGALAAPAVASGQQPDTAAARTHVVRPGDTLWSLARTYLGNPRRWREIMTANPDLIPSADSLPLGKTIRLPGRGSVAATRATLPAQQAPPPTSPPPAARNRETQPPPTQRRATDIRTPIPGQGDTLRARSGAADSVPVHRDSTPAAVPDSARALPPVRQVPERTVFYGNQPGGGPRTLPRGVAATAVADTGPLVAPRTSPNLHEVVSAPFVVEAARLDRAGAIVPVGATPPLGATTGPRNLHYTDVAVIRRPAGTAIDSGSRLITARLGPALAGVGRVAIPTGVILVSGVTGTGGLVRGSVVAQFGAIAATDVVLPYPDLPSPSPDSLVPVTRGASGRVVWIPGDVLLPSLQQPLIVDVGTADDVHAGDQLTIRGVTNGALADFARARVLRVGAHVATAVIVRESLPRLREGMSAVRTATLP